MPEIKLPTGFWSYDEASLLGPPGGFGAVFRGSGADGQAVAIKRLQSAYQAREMRIADYLTGHGLEHVIPILDAGFDADAGTNFIVMPIAEMSLQQRIAADGAVGEPEAAEITAAIAAGLEEIGDIIHRDLKPGNVLLHEGIWKLADLGLARFAEAATSLNTMREALTSAYAAPEQWRGERPSKATDVYALGCIIYALLQGAPPFAGPTTPDYNHQHQFVAAPGLRSSPHLRRLAAACLSKAPELRPSLPNLRKQVGAAALAINGSRAGRLAAAGAAVVERASLEEEQRLQRRREEERRNRVTTEALELLKATFEQLETTVLNEAPDSKVRTYRENDNLRAITLGEAALIFGVPFPKIESSFNNHYIGSSAWDVYAGGYIKVSTTYIPERAQSANLWFGRFLDGDDYRWWEVSYVYQPDCRLEDYLREFEPFGDHKSVNHVLYGVAADPRPITPEFVDEFVDRWIELFARVAEAGHSGSARVFAPNGKFPPQKVSAAFKLDRPLIGDIS